MTVTDPYSPVRLVAPLIPRWKTILFAGTSLAVAGIGLSFVVSPRYSATTRFSAQSQDNASLRAGLAAISSQFGLDLTGSALGGRESPQFYADLLATRAILEPVVSAFYLPDGATDSVQLLSFLRARGSTHRRRIEVATNRMTHGMDVELTRSGLVALTVTLGDPNVAAAVANRFFQELAQFGVEHLQFRSRQQRRFVEQRLDAAQAELRRAEDAVVTFVERNRTFDQSPALRTALARLERETEVKQEIVSTLARAFEEARLQEARDVPTLSLVEPAVPPARRSWPSRIRFAALGFFMGVAGALAWIWVRRWLRDLREAGAVPTTVNAQAKARVGSVSNIR